MPLVLSGTDGVSGVDGTASNPAIEGTDSNTGIFYPAADTVAIGTGGTEALRVNSSQNVGIGTTSPAEKLDVVGVYVQAADTRTNNTNKLFGLRMPHYANATAAVNLIGAVSTSGGNALYIGGNDTSFAGTAATSIQFYTAATGSVASGTQRMTLDASGRLLVGTTTAPNSTDIKTFINSSGGGFVGFAANGTAGGAIGCPTTSILAFYTAAGTLGSETYSERARITSGGDWLVGKTTAAASSGGNGLYVAANGFLAVNIPSSLTDTFNVFNSTAAVYRFYVTQGGTIFATSTTISAISDIRLKENIEDIDVGLDAVMALKPRKFDWKEGKGKNIKGDRGWIAQEFEQVFPEMISTWKDEQPEGEEPYKSVGADLIPVLVKAIQELNAKVEALEAQLKGNA